MPRTSPIDVDGVSVQWIADATGKVTMCRVRVRDRTGKYQPRRFKVRSWEKDGLPRFPLEAEQWAKSLRVDYLAGKASAGSASTAELGAAYVKQLRETGRSESYARSVERMVSDLDLVAPDMKDRKFGEKVTTWLASLAKAKNTTRNKKLRQLRAVVRYGLATERLERNPLLGVKRFAQEQKLKPLFTIAELAHLVSDAGRFPNRKRLAEVQAAVAQHGSRAAAAMNLGISEATLYNYQKADLDEEDPWWLPACLMVYTGCRVSEAMHLRWEWVDFVAKVIRLQVRSEFRIKNARERLIPLQPELAAILKPLKKKDGWIIADDNLRSNGSIKRYARKRPTEANYTPGFLRYLIRCGVPAQGRTAHSTRHCFVTLMLAMNVNFDRVMRMVGHSNHSTTLGYSTQVPEYESAVGGWPQGELNLRRLP